MTRPTLFFDADDTLWENAVFFRAARRAWRELMGRHGVDEEAARLCLRRLEDEGLARGAFGSGRLAANMRLAARELLGESGGRLDAECEEFARSVREHEIRYYPGVLETLDRLALTHRLVLVTMGEEHEQRGKLARAEVVTRFAGIEVIADKTSAVYESLHARHGGEVASWMIGNSPSKDVGPARAAGLVTVLFDNGAPLPPYFRDDATAPHHVVSSFAGLLDLPGFGEASRPA
ncbi:MAG: HAD family hydrolase [Planctomycetota bacterium]